MLSQQPLSPHSLEVDSFAESAHVARWVVIVALASAALILAFLSVERWWLLRGEAQLADRALKAQQLTGEILLLDERLTTSALLAATTGKAEWRQAYARWVRPLDEALREAQALAEPEVARRFREETAEANERLLKQEQAAFDALDAGREDEALVFLTSSAYQADKRLFRDGSDRFMHAIRDTLNVREAAQRRAGWVLFGGLVCCAASACLLGWMLLQRRLRRSEQQFSATQAELSRLAQYDPLTGVANRRFLEWRIEAAIAMHRRHPEQNFAVLLLDLDQFKSVNDTLGHAVGDEVLVEVARRLKAAIRGDETVARLGGDEFVIVTQPVPDLVGLKVFAERLVATVSQPIQLGQAGEVHVGASIGIAVAPDDGDDVGRIIVSADAALYRAKRTGQASVRFACASEPAGGVTARWADDASKAPSG